MSIKRMRTGIVAKYTKKAILLMSGSLYGGPDVSPVVWSTTKLRMETANTIRVANRTRCLPPVGMA
jgi:hypothetical protein